MKKRNIQYHIVWGVCCALILLSGCDSFLDVQPKGTVEQKKQFEDVQGYRDAMYGIYATMAKNELYGQSLSFGFVDEIAQLYYDKYGTRQDEVYAVQKLSYKDTKVAEKIDQIWTKSYECISYVNNVITHVDKESRLDLDLSLIRGEAYALRAFLHFDILRLFGDNIRRSPDAGGIPYATVFGLESKPVYTLKGCYEHILSDLDAASRYLKDEVKDVHDISSPEPYLRTRFMHCNLYAVWAIKARVFHFKGDLDSAAFYAEKVISASSFELVDSKKFASVKRYGKNNKELIWGLYTRQMASVYKDLFLSPLGQGSALWVRSGVRNLYEVSSFSADSKDLRFTEFFFEDPDSWYEYNFVRLLGMEEKEYNLTGVCLIRLPEMYYILAESWYKKDKEKALRYLNDVRNSRGLKDIDGTKVVTYDQFFNELMQERRKEFFGEGQIFFFYKCNNLSFMDYSNENEILPSKDVFVLPWPKAEQEYGVTNQ